MLLNNDSNEKKMNFNENVLSKIKAIIKKLTNSLEFKFLL